MTHGDPEVSVPPLSRSPEDRWPAYARKPLRGRVALVAGATRGAGRAIAVSLALAGATVYATGRSVRGHPATPGRYETIDETAEMIRSHGGRAYAVRVDHTVESEVRRLVTTLARREHGRLDILVNDVWGGEDLIEWGRPPWTMTYQVGRELIERAVLSHILTSRCAVPLMVRRKRGVVFEVTDGVRQDYRGSFFYDLVKTSVIRLALAYHEEFVEAGLRRMAAIAVSPGFLRSEYMLDKGGVTEATWRDAIPRERHWATSETPYFLARGIVALAADPSVRRWSGTAVGSWQLAKQYRFVDLNGTRPDWGRVVSGTTGKGA
jgi:NAD(P)-dependent dehydrogenase (short-subunit alcohol dehydrogenase family)